MTPLAQPSKIHDLHVAPLEQLDARVRWQHHPAVAASSAGSRSSSSVWTGGTWATPGSCLTAPPPRSAG
jgi:hypothetical protein